MCGIVGYIGTKDAREIIINGLKRLEYRGYDSAGIALQNCENGDFNMYKDKGRVAHLESITDFSYSSCLGIGHTRWATHGVPNQENSHPQTSNTGRFFIVHNGVIDNYKELITSHLNDSVFSSETDTEVIAHLIERYSYTMSVNEAIRKTMSLLEGSYALAIIDTYNPYRLYACKNKSPLLIGVSDDGVIVASDVMACVGYSDRFVPLEDKTFVEIDGAKYHIRDIIGKEVVHKERPIDVDYFNIEKGEFSHFMLKEIMEQPAALRTIIGTYFNDDGSVRVNRNILDAIRTSDRLYIIAAGTSMNAGYVGKELFETLAEIPTEVHIASEFAYNMPLLSDNPLFIFISQSGETADLRAVLVNIKAKGYRSLTITNVKTSTLAREADHYVEIMAGPEIAVASTKAYTAQIAILSILAYGLESHRMDLRKELSKVAISIENIIDRRDYIEALVEEYLTKRNCFYIGRGIDYYGCLEASLKLKEISYIQTEGFAAGELKHGTIALIEEGTPVIAIISQRAIAKNTRSNLNEVKSRGAKTLVISTKSVHQSEDQIVVDDVYESFSPILTVIPAQFIAYYAALHRGYDIDKPRNLAKSVTVE
ncbi:glutamine--fructose-6-phosphate transaminase (isomerizing) [Candidatus Xianfuyuplasma coldseepsis]|uniref:Glutamine--fructose-6-phosphate aminotransferase [isomerizing] n=1 Tax=Candidatus Xianfuyuplasma coldseepsis TaxID=2782163 RepID=A0A7L7KUP3_9MOLU|nr:glutamine--fructose-6-phosphate transaminase (isomerizing) [Xianfuyuplasma coldseepsis]QMS85714.1 glutamine--fructose-6-phosphate transaminase (isomerizing) [Xianfuyuplasma coldseepsis]